MSDSKNTTPVKAPPGPSAGPGHSRLASRRPSALGGSAQLALYGSADKPVLYADDPDMGSGVNLQPDRDELVRFAREILAFLGAAAAPELPAWRPANNGTGARPWFLCRYSGHDDMSVPMEDRYRFGAADTLIRYGSYEAAQCAADKLNARELAGRLS